MTEQEVEQGVEEGIDPEHWGMGCDTGCKHPKSQLNQLHHSAHI